ncbi:MAG TPA: LacI family DNA-binding transcriptional regulator [Streptosporangiaceae bacterium]|nr:LacI family DNA-binding transcriptional regulator [Streptosporangiaceae bacterium]
MSRLNSAHRVNIAEVAAAAGVSVGTVSRVLNESPNVREHTRRRVAEVMKSLNYRPSRLAESLSRGQTRTVVILVPFLTRPSVTERLAGAIGVLDGEGFDTVVRNVETVGQRDRHLAALTTRHEADGAVVVSLRLNGEHLAALRSGNVPLAMVDTEAPGVPCTVVDDIMGGSMATEHLINLGHRRIGFVGDSPDDLGFVSTRRRLLGYRRTLSRHRLEYDPAIIRLGRHSASVAAAMAQEMLDLPSPPTAIFAGSDTQALGVLAAADKSGHSVPDDLSVIGYDDIESAALLGLSTVHQPLAESGARGARRLCALIRGQLVRPLREELPLSVVARTSSAMYAVAGVA